MSQDVKSAKNHVWHIADVMGQISKEIHSKIEISVKELLQSVLSINTCEGVTETRLNRGTNCTKAPVSATQGQL